MPKVADRYLVIDPWAVIEEGFHPDRSRVSESIFSLGNEYMGVRGYFEEGYSGDSLPGSYLNGVYEEAAICHPQHFKGLATRRCFMVNAMDWLYVRMRVDDETLDLAHSAFTDFTRRLDLRSGTLERALVWHTASGKRLKLSFLRFLSMATPYLGCQRVMLEAVDFSGPVEIVVGLDFSPRYELMDRNFWACPRKDQQGDVVAILGQTESSGQKAFSGFQLHCSQSLDASLVEDEQFIGLACSLPLEQGRPVSLDKVVVNYAEKRGEVTAHAVWEQGISLAAAHCRRPFDQALVEHAAYWKRVWDTLDVTIEGDPANQQGVRFCIFQLHQTYHGVDPSLNVGAKGLTGEVYYGWTFWDTETYCLPFYLFNNPQAARNLLTYRYRTLPQALERAEQLDCQGARYPMGTIDGTESVGTWQHGDLEIHVSAAVAYGIWHYVNVSGDRDFLYREGIEMLIQISRFFASRGGWSPLTGEYGFWGVMGPDEFHMMVHNNCYTNLLAQKTFRWSLETLDEMAQAAPDRLQAVNEKVGLAPREPDDWRHKADKMRIPYHAQTGLFEQHDGYFDLPRVAVDSIPPAQFPIYKHWAYDSIFRVDPIKQPDVLLFLFFFSHDYSLQVKRANYDVYEPRCIHESSLSPSIHSIMAAELGRHQDAYRYSLHAARLDLDNYNRNTHEGLHTTSMAAAWLNVVYGFGGLRSDGDVLSFRPSIPRAWRSFGFRILYRGSILSVGVDKETVALQVVDGPPVEVQVFGEVVTVDGGGAALALPPDRRA